MATAGLVMDLRMPSELRHVYRALLRAATYLPDAAAREYVHGHVVHRFRSVSDKIKYRMKQGQPCEDLIRRYHSPKHIGAARKASRQLERAGLGSMEDLKKVLLLTYGRTGKRRRELMAKLIRPEESTLPQDQGALEQLIHQPRGAEPPRFSPTSKIMALVKSQQSNQPLEVAKAVIRHLAPRIPKENTWGRPVPLKLRASIERRHLASVLDRILPPLPEHEWNRLRDLSTGAIPVENPPLRRSNAGRRPVAGDENDAKVLKYFTAPVNEHASDFDDVRVDAEQGATCWATPFRDVEIPRSSHHTFTPRYMRRLYASIWNMTPTMSQDPDTKKWVTKWGGMRSPSHMGHFTRAAANDMEFWEGLDAPRQEQVARQ
jgi:hypothetical protein